MILEPIVFYIFIVLGLVLGYYLGYLTPEEYSLGKFYYNLGQIAVLILLFIFEFPRSFDLMIFFSFIIGFIVMFLIKEVYLAFGVSFFSDIFSLTISKTGIIFIYGLIEGTHIYNLKNKNSIIRKALLFTLMFPILWVNGSSIFEGFLAGSLLSAIILKIKKVM